MSLPRMRTIAEAAQEYRSNDQHTAVSKNFIRQIIVTGTVPSIKAGRKYLVNMDLLEGFLNGEKVTATAPLLQTGIIRPVGQNERKKP